MQEERLHLTRTADTAGQSIVYWMRCEHRRNDNWGLLYALEQANANNLPLITLFCLAGSTPHSSYRQQDFLFRGIETLKPAFEDSGLHFVNSNAATPEDLARHISTFTPQLLVTDYSALKPQQLWLHAVLNHTECSAVQVDSRNIVPTHHVSPKQEYAARTLRPKIHRELERFLTPFPTVTRPKVSWLGDMHSEPLTPPAPEKDAPSAIMHFPTGEEAGRDVLHHFIQNRIHHYMHRNDPTKNVLSNLSPYLHYGMLSAQRVVLEMLDNKHIPQEAKEVFLEELVVRRELADNFCFYNPLYDSVNSFPDWAQKTLNKHRADPREYIYSLKEFEDGTTHDALWNAAQHELVHHGKMHGYMRMYWAKKILEWTASPEEAMHYAIYLNDKYSLDGVDCNGYTGIAWSIGGVHDRPWKERPIFGTVRYMSYNGAKRKFDIQGYIDKVRSSLTHILEE